jgi:hypothetical protein
VVGTQARVGPQASHQDAVREARIGPQAYPTAAREVRRCRKWRKQKLESAPLPAGTHLLQIFYKDNNRKISTAREVLLDKGRITQVQKKKT